MNFNTSTSQSNATLTKAILIYESQKPYQQVVTAFASVHDVSNVGTEKKPNTQIMPGEAITRESLLQLMGSLGEQYIINTDLIPETVLSYSPSHLVWWMPAGLKRVYFNNRELGKKSAVVPHPALLFIVVNKLWYVFSLNENKRPTKASLVCHSPYFNVYDNGSICTGSAATPDKLSCDAIPAWETAFFDSEFTHVNGSTKKVSHPNGEYAFWKEMLSGAHADVFPNQYLVPTKSTLSDVLAGIGKSLKVN